MSELPPVLQEDSLPHIAARRLYRSCVRPQHLVEASKTSGVMKKRSIVACGLAGCLITQHCEVYAYSGSEYVQDCEADSGVNLGYCLGYTAAVVSLSAGPGSVFQWCHKVPDGVTSDQTVKVVVKWLSKDHPELLHVNVTSVIVRALSEVWPCRQ